MYVPPDHIDSYAKAARTTFWVTFGVGTLIFFGFLLTNHYIFLALGFGYTMIAILYNAVTFLVLLQMGFLADTDGRKIIRACLLMLVNIPICYAYGRYGTWSLNRLKIKLTNVTPYTLTDVTLNGCDDDNIGQLEPGETETIRFSAHDDCAMNVYYVINGQHKQESVIIRAETGSDVPILHKLGGKNEPQYVLRPDD